MADALKAEGNKAFSAKDYPTAMYVHYPAVMHREIERETDREREMQRLTGNSDKFTQAIAIESSNHILYSNRSAVYSSQGDYQKALDDATKATEIKPDWSKGYVRKGAALRGQGDLCE